MALPKSVAPLGLKDLGPQDVAAAAVLAFPFLLAAFILEIMAPATAGQLPHADPLVALFRAGLGRWGLLFVCAGALAAWSAWGRPTNEMLRGALPRAALGLAAAICGALLIRLIAGPNLPSFVPPEESAKPGLTQGLQAGLIEEVLFRLALLPGLYFLLRDKLGCRASAAVAIAAAALCFALSHELGPGAGPFQAKVFIARALFPGAFMSLLFFALGPAFIVTLHCGAHLIIPLLFA